MKTTPLEPFGLLVEADSRLADLQTAQVKDWVRDHRLLLLRGVASPADDKMLSFCRTLGEVLEWEFGAVNELQVKSDAKNYIYTPSAVPFHWDGAFVGRIPHYIFFHCVTAPPPEAGGETTFSDAVAALNRVSPDERRLWDELRITYTTQKVVHYGGSFTSPLVGVHPAKGEPVLRFAEPVVDLNPVSLSCESLDAAQLDALVARLQHLLYDPRLLYEHRWRDGDVVIADNHALLHGRRAFRADAPRRLRRVNVL